MSVDTLARRAAADALDAVETMQRSPAGRASHAGSIEGLLAYDERRRRRQRVVVVAVAVAVAAIGFAGLIRAFRSETVPADRITPDNVDLLEVGWVGRLPDAWGAVVGEGYVVAYSLEGTVAAFPADCAADGEPCDPLWTADVTTAETEVDTQGHIASVPVIGAGHVFVSGDRCFREDGGDACADDLYAFPLDCRTDGGRCSPRWIAPFAGGVMFIDDWGSVATDGTFVYASGNRLEVFPIECGDAGAICEPLWWSPRATLSVTISGVTAIVADERRAVAAYPIDCRTDGGVCEPLWWGEGGSYAEPTVVDGVVYSAGERTLAAYDVTCGSQGGRCEPRWVAISEEGETFSGSPPLVAGGIVYVETWRAASNDGNDGTDDWIIHAFPTDCSRNGEPCRPLWTAEYPAGGPRLGDMVAASDRLYVNVTEPGDDRPRGFVAYDSACRTDGGVCTPIWRAEGRGTPVVDDGLVFVTDGKEVRAYTADCGTGGETCRPVWRATVGDRAATPVLEGGRLLVGSSDGLSVFTVYGAPLEEEAP